MMFRLGVMAFAGTSYLPEQRVIWPDNRDVAPVDTVVYVVEYGSGSQEPVLLRDADAAVVEVTPHLLAGVASAWWVLVPDEPLAPGGYSVSLALGDVATFTVGADVAEVASAPVPYRRWMNAGCADYPDTLSYRACGGGVLHLAAVGADEPPTPTLDNLGDSLVAGAGEDSLEIADPFRAEAEITVWIGDLDEAGRFTGWWDGDAVGMPSAGSTTTEGPNGTPPSTGGTPTSVAECPLFSGWELLSETDCSPTELVTTTETETTTVPGGCGCRGAPGPASGLWVLLVALRRRRRGQSVAGG